MARRHSVALNNIDLYVTVQMAGQATHRMSAPSVSKISVLCALEGTLIFFRF